MPEKSNLDLLRSVAVLMVVTDHTFLARGIYQWHRWLLGEIGLFGVYLFFLHTSLVLMWSLERRPNPLDFYIRRIFRLYPLAIAAILLATVARAPAAAHTEAFFHSNPVTPLTLLWNCLLVRDLIGHALFLHGVTWSLSLEVYMYLLLPALFFYARVVRRRWPIVLLWLLAVLFARRLFPNESVGNIFPTVIPDFLSGIIAYVGFMHARPRLPSWTLLPLLAILFSFYMSFRTFQGVRLDWIACLALALVLPYTRQFKWKSGRRLAHTVAQYSYGIYLFHPFALLLSVYVLSGRPLALQLGVEALAIAAAAFAAYHLIEFPMIKLGARVAARLAHEPGLPSERSLKNLEPAP
jgi:peptidoglycan/LPS O-acetylase OafA/YrhL